MPVTDEPAILSIADDLFTAMAHSDVGMIQEIWNDDIAVWHSGDRADNNYDRAYAIICWFLNRTTQRRYEILDRRAFEGGFVQQHILHATRTTTGAPLALRVWLVATLTDDLRIGRIDEYFDPADLAPLLDER